MIQIKEGVQIKFITEEMLYVIHDLKSLYWVLGIKDDPVITSWFDGKHREGSLHPHGQALDLRIRRFTMTQRRDLVQAMRKNFGPDYDVILEADHIHIEYDPMKGHNKIEQTKQEAF